MSDAPIKVPGMTHIATLPAGVTPRAMQVLDGFLIVLCDEGPLMFDHDGKRIDLSDAPAEVLVKLPRGYVNGKPIY